MTGSSRDNRADLVLSFNTTSADAKISMSAGNLAKNTDTKPKLEEQIAVENTDVHLWPQVSHPDAPEESIHATKDGGIGINVGGLVIVMPLRKWHESVQELQSIRSAELPVEPRLIKALRTGCSDAMQVAIDHIDALQSALKLAQEERDAKLEQLQIMETHLNLAESINRRMVELLKEPYGYVYVTNNTWTHFTTMKPPDDAYDEGSLMPVFAMSAELLKEVLK